MKKIIDSVNSILLLCLAAIVIWYMFNSLIAYKLATTNDYISFAGGIVGSLIAAIIAIISLVFTLRHNEISQQKSNNLQNALKLEDNLNRRLENERNTITNAYNSFNKFVFIAATAQSNANDHSATKKMILDLYENFSSTINCIRFNSEIFYDKSLCEGCELCPIKTHGILVKNSTAIQKFLMELEKKCNELTGQFALMIDKGSECMELLNKKNSLERICITAREILARNPEVQDIKQNYEEKLQEILAIDVAINEGVAYLKAQNSLVRETAEKLNSDDKIIFANLIQKYFDSYDLYIRERVYAAKEGRHGLNNKCLKLDFENNHKLKGD